MNDQTENMDNAIQYLLNAGLVAKRGETGKNIRGGTKRRETEIDNISILSEPFGIDSDGISWIATVPYKGQLDLEKAFSNVSDAAKFVAEYYLNELPNYRK